jgi:hypothetical protein
MRFLKTTLPVLMAFVMGVIGIAVYYVPHRAAANLKTEITVWAKIIGGVTMFMGAYSLLRHHYVKMKRRQSGWGYSGLLGVFFAITLAAALYNSGQGPLVNRQGNADDALQWLYNWICTPASATIFATLGFFICSAAYRTFRAKTLEAGVLLIAALIVMLGQVPLAAVISPKIQTVSGWLMDVPNMAVKRAILFGICLGSVGTSLRVMFGIERSYMGGDQ